MEVYALVGHSGTGKSHHAPLLSHQYQIDYIIDDGLLIKGNMVLAGRSAKRENTRFGAVKRALFQDPEHAQRVREHLEEIWPERVLILGTSRRMTQVIAGRLGLPEPAHYIFIEDVVSPEEIRAALKVRETQNRHVIPLPTFAIKKDFPGYIVDPLRSFFSIPAAANPDNVAVERSIIRPIYSSLGNFFISEHVVNDLVSHIVVQIPGVYKVSRTEIQTQERRVFLHVDLILALHQVPGGNLLKVLEQAQKKVKEEIEFMTGFYLDRVNVTAKKLFLEENNLPDFNVTQ
jgi:uncharacterized alkaline shock family protein YloU/adenylate kinase family enzyme